MNAKSVIQNALAHIFGVEETVGGIVATTHCLYPSGEFVRVLVRHGEQTFHVCDDGGGVREIEAVGANPSNPDRAIAHILKPLGLRSRNGVIQAPPCDASELACSIAFVANASKVVAEWLFTHQRVRPHASFREVLANYLHHTFPKKILTHEFLGESNKPHKFENVISLSNGVLIVVDPVIHEASSINARLVANLDVQRAHHPRLQQRIVYDDADSWSPAELNLLGIGATVVPYSRAPEVLSRLAETA